MLVKTCSFEINLSDRNFYAHKILKKNHWTEHCAVVELQFAVYAKWYAHEKIQL